MAKKTESGTDTKMGKRTLVSVESPYPHQAV